MSTIPTGKGPADEPVAWGGAVTALVVAAIPVLRAFNVSVSEDQANAILGILAPLIAFGTLLVRSQVTPTAKAQDAVNSAAAAPPGAPVPKL